jgi:uncharacterized protein (UPF0333 family)
MRGRGQTSVEITVIIGGLLLVFLAFFAVNSDISSTFNSRFSNDKLVVALEDIGQAAEMVYLQGEGAKTEVFISVPNNVQSSGVSDQTLTFYTYPITDSDNYHPVYRILDFNVSGTLPNMSGNYLVSVESYGSYVNVSYS